MSDDKRWFWVGSRPEVLRAATDVFGRAPHHGDPKQAGDGDIVVVDPVAERGVLAQLPYGHAYSGVRALKQKKGLVVYVVVDAGDEVGVQLARFALADGVMRWLGEEGRLAADELHATGRPQRRPSVDALLTRLQGEAGAAGQENSLQRLLRFEREDSLLHRLQDAETGLFDGPYATLKIDEEWKRAHRFHQPLSLLLLDMGFSSSLGDADRRAAVAEAAGIFLNECRDNDVLARFSPDVFLVLLPGTGASGAQVLADRIVSALRERLGGRVEAAPAGGLATVPSGEIPDRRSFVAVAEACLKQAQATGAGGVCSSWQ